MITFNPRQLDCAWHVRKNENIGTVNFTTQIAPSICTVIHTKRVKPDATIFKSRCSRTVVCYRFDRVEALPLVSTRFLRLAHISPKTARSPARWSRDGREQSGKTSGEMSRVISTQCPGNAAERPSRRLARQLALRRTGTCNVRLETCETTRNLAAQQPRNISQDDLSESRHHVFNHPVLKL